VGVKVGDVAGSYTPPFDAIQDSNEHISEQDQIYSTMYINCVQLVQY